MEQDEPQPLSWHEQYERERADRLKVDPTRPLPDEYDDEESTRHTDQEERAKLAKKYLKIRGFGPRATVDEILPLMVGLPVRVLRDILATSEHRQAGAPGTVAAVFMRSAQLLECARFDSEYVPRPRDLLGESDVAFVGALREQIAASGSEILLPPVPVLRDWKRDEDDEGRQLLGALGWIRVAVGHTSGQKLHSPRCHVLKSGRGSVATADHIPWWRAVAEHPYDVCGVCYGPCMRDLVPMAGFTAAVDVWHHRGRGGIEKWQQAAFQRLLAVTSMARSEAAEPDITLTHRIIDVLSEDPPGKDGWEAYYLLVGTDWNNQGKEFKQLPLARQEAARVLARDRMSVLEAILPEAKRPPCLPQGADQQSLRDRYKDLSRMLADEVPQLDELLFTLPGATRAW